MSKHQVRSAFCVFYIALGTFSAVAQTPKTVRTFLPVVTRVQGATTFFYTSLDVTNHSALSSVDVKYNFVSSDNQVRSEGTLKALKPLTTFHTDDFIQWLAQQGAITSAQAASLFGTLLLTAADVNFTAGNDISAVARVWNYAGGASGPTVGLAFRSTPLSSSSRSHLISLIRDTTHGGTGPVVSTNLGIANTGLTSSLDRATGNVDVRLSFYDASSGTPIGDEHVLTLSPGQVVQINDVFRSFTLPSTDVVARIDGPDQGSPQLFSYVVLKDVQSNDGSYFEMTSAPPPPPLPGNAYDGTWERSQSGSKVSFIVSGNSITSVSIPYSIAGCSGIGTMKPVPPIPITKHGFYIDYASPAGHYTTLSGTFSSTSEGSATWGSDTYLGIFCGNLVIGFDSGSTTFPIKKK